MAAPNDNISMALYCDFENVALGVRDAKYDKFNIRPVLERLLLKGSIVVKKAYCDWERYKEFKPQMHEASFELIEIPHVRMSGKNSADIRLVVDALDLCYTKSHVNTFVIISGDSDFSPLVSKLRENDKYVIGVGVKDSTSDLLVANCDEFIFIDDLVRESRRAAANRETRQAPTAAAARRPAPVEEEPKSKESLEVRKNRAIDLASETFEALMAERGDNGKIWASALKQAIKRRKPDFNEVYFGFRTFGNLLEEAQGRGLLEIGRDDKSGSYVYRSSRALAAEAALAAQQAQAAAAPAAPAASATPTAATPTAATPTAATEPVADAPERGRRQGNGRSAPIADTALDTPSGLSNAFAPSENSAGSEALAAGEPPIDTDAPATANDETTANGEDMAAPASGREEGRRRGGRKTAAQRRPSAPSAPSAPLAPQAADDAMPAVVHAANEAMSPAIAPDDAIDETPAPGREIDLPISNAQRRAMRSSARKPARSKPKAEVPAAAIAVAQPVAEAQAAPPVQPADAVDAADAPQKRNGARSGRGRKPKAAANVE
jgi:uncharacterized LabA/DUF88 family protein